MTDLDRLDVLARGWRGRLFAALVALIAGLPGLLALPVLDRDEAGFVQSTAQMLETGDFIDIKLQDQAREREPIGLHWLQAASVSAFSSTEARQVWAYRIPSLLGAMLAAAACAWGAAVFFGPGAGAMAGAILGGCLILSTEAGIGKTDAVLCGAITLAIAAMGRLYAASNGGPAADRRTRLLFWLALALAVLDKGLVGPMVAVVTGLTLWAWDRRAPWIRTLGWTWGLILFAALVGPWLAAITVRTDGQAWGGDLVSSLLDKRPGGGPWGLHVLMAPLLLFPAAALLPAALVEGWKARTQPGPRFALCWLIANWLVFERAPVRLIHHALPLYGALAWLAAFAMTRTLGRYTRIAGAVFSVLSGAAIAAGIGYVAARYGDPSSAAPAVFAGVLAVTAGVCGAWTMTAPNRTARYFWPTLAAAGGLGVAAHAAVVVGLAPRLQSLWLSRGVVETLDRSGLNPRNGLAPGPVTVVGYGEPSLVFGLGTETELGDPPDAVEAISEGRPVVIDADAAAWFQHALNDAGLKATLVGSIAGLDYADGQQAVLRIYRSDSPPPDNPADDAAEPDSKLAQPSPSKSPALKPGAALKPGEHKP